MSNEYKVVSFADAMLEAKEAKSFALFEGVADDSEGNLKKAKEFKKSGDMKSYHDHMANFHASMRTHHAEKWQHALENNDTKAQNHHYKKTLEHHNASTEHVKLMGSK